MSEFRISISLENPVVKFYWDLLKNYIKICKLSHSIKDIPQGICDRDSPQTRLTDMSIKPSQLIIAGGIGVIAGVTIALMTVQSPSSKLSPPPQTQSPRPPEPPITSVPASVTNTSPPSETPPIAIIKPPVEGCKISMAVVKDPDAPLNVRSTPEVTEGNIVGQLNNNTFVFVIEEKNGWFKINNPVSGWIAKSRTESSCSIVEKNIEFLPGGNAALVQGKIIGGGSHNYKITAIAGQTLTIENYKSVFPMVMSPNGELLTDNLGITPDTKVFSNKLPLTGEYTLQLDSNYKGFEYEFLVKVE